jgi:hypothetical protein
VAEVDFVVKARDEASAAIQRVAGATGDLGSALKALAVEGGVFGAIAVGAIAVSAASVTAALSVAQMAETLDRTARSAGTSTQNIQVMQRAFEEAGVAGEDASQALTFLNRAIGRGEPLLKSLGITTRDSYEAFLQLSDIFGQSEDAAKKQAVALKLTGKSSAELVGIMDGLRGVIGKTREEMQRHGGLLSPEQVKNAKELDDGVDRLKGTFKDLWTNLGILAVPATTALVGFFAKVTEGALAFARAITDGVLGPLKELGEAAKNTETFDERLAKAKEEARKVGGHVQIGVPTIEGVEVSAPRVKSVLDSVDLTELKESPREKKLKDIADVLRVSTVEAERLLVALEKVEKASAADDLLKKLHAAGVNTQTLPGAGLTIPEPEAPPAPEVPFDTSAFEAWKKGLEDAQLQARDAMHAIGDDWRKAVDEILSATGLMQQGLEGLWNGLQQGFSTVFANLGNKAQTFRSAFKTIISSLVQEVRQILARLVATKLFGLILKLIPGLGTAAGFLIDTAAEALRTSVLPTMAAIGGAAGEALRSTLVPATALVAGAVGDALHDSLVPTVSRVAGQAAQALRAPLSPSAVRLAGRAAATVRGPVLPTVALGTSGGGVAGTGLATSARLAGAADADSGRIAGSRNRPGGAGPAPVPMTVNIYAIDRAGIESSLRDPRGSMRAAMRDSVLARAY